MLVERCAELLDPRQVVERLGDGVALRSLAALDRTPRLRVIRNDVADREGAGADRIQDPARAPLDLLRNHGRTTRARCTSAGRGSSRAHIASTYGGRCGRGRAPRVSVIAHRLPTPRIRTGSTRRPIASRYAISGRSTPHAAAS